MAPSMALTRTRDPEATAAGVARWLAAQRGATVEVTAVAQPSAGLSSETLLVDLTVDGAPEALAVRLPPLGPGLFPTYDLDLQARAQQAAADGGVPTAVPAEVVDDEGWVGSPFLVMPVVTGRLPGPVPALDDWIRDAAPGDQDRLYDGVLDAVARLHRVEPPDRVPRRDLVAELAHWRGYLDWCAEGGPVPALLAEALAWCAERRPAAEPPAVLLWGDVRLGNVVVGTDWGPAALLDWEMATVGAPEHDLGWWWGLEAMAEELLGRRVDGFPTREQAQARYEAAVGRPLQDLGWYEVLALVRSTAILVRVEALRGRVVDDANPVLDVLARRLV